MDHAKHSQIDESVAREQRLNRVRGISVGGGETIIGIAGGTNDSGDHIAMSGVIYPSGAAWETTVDDDLVMPEGVLLATVLGKFSWTGADAMDGWGEIVTPTDTGRFRLEGEDTLSFEITVECSAGVFPITCPITGFFISPSVNIALYMHGFPA